VATIRLLLDKWRFLQRFLNELYGRDFISEELEFQALRPGLHMTYTHRRKVE